jgi:hypothetical protein
MLYVAKLRFFGFLSLMIAKANITPRGRMFAMIAESEQEIEKISAPLMGFLQEEALASPHLNKGIVRMRWYNKEDGIWYGGSWDRVIELNEEVGIELIEEIKEGAPIFFDKGKARLHITIDQF